MLYYTIHTIQSKFSNYLPGWWCRHETHSRIDLAWQWFSSSLIVRTLTPPEITRNRQWYVNKYSVCCYSYIPEHMILVESFQTMTFGIPGTCLSKLSMILLAFTRGLNSFPKTIASFLEDLQTEFAFSLPGYFVVTSRHISFLLIGMRNSKHLYQYKHI